MSVSERKNTLKVENELKKNDRVKTYCNYEIFMNIKYCFYRTLKLVIGILYTFTPFIRLTSSLFSFASVQFCLSLIVASEPQNVYGRRAQ